jgi:hypothetical protein
VKDTDQEKNANPRKNYVCWWECLKGKEVKIRSDNIIGKFADIHKPSNAAKGSGK